eukprot:TRINITY_DN4572_c0_g1_i4.p1 TRINITY_DN4572_c0_g1~~TRINITY_DN4572_c0_g1_i4.p1  ORF type:complete len:363 (-),score=64.04 TRINITY_DN4572_c0_g1_i4:99-1187(-)
MSISLSTTTPTPMMINCAMLGSTSASSSSTTTTRNSSAEVADNGDGEYGCCYVSCGLSVADVVTQRALLATKNPTPPPTALSNDDEYHHSHTTTTATMLLLLSSSSPIQQQSLHHVVLTFAPLTSSSSSLSTQQHSSSSTASSSSIVTSLSINKAGGSGKVSRTPSSTSSPSSQLNSQDHQLMVVNGVVVCVNKTGIWTVDCAALASSISSSTGRNSHSNSSGGILTVSHTPLTDILHGQIKWSRGGGGASQPPPSESDSLEVVSASGSKHRIALLVVGRSSSSNSSATLTTSTIPLHSSSVIIYRPYALLYDPVNSRGFSFDLQKEESEFEGDSCCSSLVLLLPPQTHSGNSNHNDEGWQL